MSLEKLVEDAKSLGMFYAKDWGALLCGLQADGEIYLHGPSDERKESMQNAFEIMNGFYQDIPFNDLKDKKYEPLFVVRDLLPKVHDHLVRFIEKPSETSYQALFELTVKVHEAGQIYRKYFDNALEAVKSHPNGKSYQMSLTGITGTKWQY